MYTQIQKDRLASCSKTTSILLENYDSAKAIPTELTALARRHLHRYPEVLAVSLLVLERQNEDDDTLKNNRAPQRTPDAMLHLR